MIGKVETISQFFAGVEAGLAWLYPEAGMWVEADQRNLDD